MPRRRKNFLAELKAHPLVSRWSERLSEVTHGPLGRVFGPLTETLRRFGLMESINRFILTIGDEGATLVMMRGNTVLDAIFVGPESEDGLGTLRSYVDKDPRARVLVAADVLEQMYREDQMPKVGRFDRGNVMRRRLDIAFPQDRLRAALPLASGKVLFASLPETEAIAQWVEFLESLSNPIIGFCLMPLESASIAAELGPAGNADGGQVWRVMVTQQATSGFRQIFETEDRMLVTRLAQRPTAEMTPQIIAQLIERELRSSISYVKRLGYSEQDRLDLIVLAEPEVCQAVEERDLPISSLTAYTPYQAGLLLGIGEVAPEESGLSDVLHARWMAAKRKPMVVLPTPKLREKLLQDQIFKMGFAAAAALSIFAVGDLVDLTLDAFESTTTTSLLEQQLATEKQSGEVTRARLTGLDVPLEDVLLVDETAEIVARNRIDILQLLRSVAEVVGTDAKVQKATFRVPALTGATPGKPAPAPAPGPKLARGRAAPGSGEVAYEVSLVVKFDSDPAAPQLPLEQAKALQDRLTKQFPGNSISTVKLPVNPLRQVLEGTGSEAARPTGPQTAEFLIQKKGG